MPPISENLLAAKRFSEKPEARSVRESERKLYNDSSQFSGEREASSSLPTLFLIWSQEWQTSPKD